jgi:hypothetical protein
MLAERALGALNGAVPESYGKAAMVGGGRRSRNRVAFLTTVFAAGVRATAGGGAAWISSMTKVCDAGASIDVPLANKDALFGRSRYDGISITISDAPLPDEVVVMCAHMRAAGGSMRG